MNLETRYKWLWYATVIILAGACFNFAAIMGNNGRMPVKVSFDAQDEYHCYCQHNNEVNHWQFTDIIDLRVAWVSVGDCLALSGGVIIIFMFVQGIIQRRAERQ